MNDTIVRDIAWTFSSPFVVLPRENIDTDQIIPARFLTTTSRGGLGPHAFEDWRYLADGSPNAEFPLNSPSAAGARVLVAGHNFGCGSSREHAVWALMGAGFRAVISSTFADIFRGNALGNGLLPIQVDAPLLTSLISHARPGQQLGIDLERCTLTLPDGNTVPFAVPPFARHCLLHGIDEMQFLLETRTDADAHEARYPTSLDTRAAGAAA